MSLTTVLALVWLVGGSNTSNGAGHGGLGGGSGTRRTATTSHTGLPTLTATFPALGRDGGAIPSLPYPASGEGAVAVLGSGVIAESRGERPVPIASLTKLMTAYLVLRAHPLVGDEQGPRMRFTAATHREWIWYSENDLSNVELVNGEVLTERQLLEALLLPSADNVADIFARWVGGTEAHFVAMMNATARSLGMRHTHYADASGVDPHSRSTAADQALLAAVDMRNPVFRSIVATPDVAFPVEGHIWNVNPALGVDGIVGIKSGFTSEAHGCLVTAAWRRVSGRSVLVIAAVTGQPLGLGQAAQDDETLIDAVSPRLEVSTPFGSRSVAARVTIPWSHEYADAAMTGPVEVVSFPGVHYSSRLVATPVTRENLKYGWPAGTVVAELEVRSQFGRLGNFPVRLTRMIDSPPPGTVLVRAHVPVSLAPAGRS